MYIVVDAYPLSQLSNQSDPIRNSVTCKRRRATSTIRHLSHREFILQLGGTNTCLEEIATRGSNALRKCNSE